MTVSKRRRSRSSGGSAGVRGFSCSCESEAAADVIMVFWATLSRTWAAASPFVTGIRRQHVMAKFNVVFVLGGPGAGKGTQCANIVEKYGYAHLSAGDLLRAERQRPGELGEMIEHHIRNGTIVPVEVTCKLLEQAMKTSHKQNFLIDGFPRNEDNMNGWNREMHDKVNLKFVLFFDCPEEVCVQRCLHRGESGSGRSDDNLDSLKKRIATYNGASMPIIKHYDSHGLVRKVDCAKPVEEVWKDVQKLDF